MKESESLKTNNRVTDKHWKNFDPWEFCGQDSYCKRASRDKGGCVNGCIVPKLYRKLAEIEDREEEENDVKKFVPSEELFVKVDDFQKMLLNFIGSDLYMKILENTADSKDAGFMTGLAVSGSLITSNCELHIMKKM